MTAAAKKSNDGTTDIEDFDDVPTSVTMALQQFTDAIEHSRKALDNSDRAADRLRRAVMRRHRPSLRVVRERPAVGRAAAESSDDA